MSHNFTFHSHRTTRRCIITNATETAALRMRRISHSVEVKTVS